MAFLEGQPTIKTVNKGAVKLGQLESQPCSQISQAMPAVNTGQSTQISSIFVPDKSSLQDQNFGGKRNSNKGEELG